MHFHERGDTCKRWSWSQDVLSRSHRHNYGLGYATEVIYYKLLIVSLAINYISSPYCALCVLQVKKEEVALLNYSICTAICYSDKGAPVNVAGKIKVCYSGDIINTDHVEANSRVGCTSLQNVSVRGMKIETL